MKYLKFEIKNFKWIKGPLVIDLTSRTNIFPLVWLNESGKTSILEAINYFEKGIWKEDAHKLIHKAEKAWFSWEIYVKATIYLEPEDLENIKKFTEKECGIIISDLKNPFCIKKYHRFEDSKWKASSSLRDIGLCWMKGKSKIKKDIHDNANEERNKIINYIKKSLPNILYYPNFLYNFPEKIYLDEKSSDSTQQKLYREVLQDILTYCGGPTKTYTIQKHLLDRLLDPTEQNKEAMDSMLLNIGNILNQKVLWSRGAIFSLDSQNRTIVVKHGVEGEWDEKRFFISFTIQQSNWVYSIAERSLWFKWFFSFLLFTEFRKVRPWANNNEEILFLLDEPASNLHQNCQKQLLELFRSISQTAKIVYSTHSHHLISPRELISTYIIRNLAMDYKWIGYDSWDTDIQAILYKKFVASNPNETTHYKPILDALDVEESYLERVNNLIYLEGKNDYYTFKYMEYFIFKRLDLYSFYPWASVDKYESILRLEMAMNKTYICLFDGDPAGERAKRNYIKNLWDELLTRIFTLKDIESEIFSWFTTEDLFSEEDKLAITKLLFPKENKFDKSKFNAGIQHLYITREIIELSQQTVENFKKVFDFIGNKLWNFQN